MGQYRRIDNGILATAQIEAIHDDYEGFRILLQNEAEPLVVRLSFDSPVAYVVSDESFRLRAIQGEVGTTPDRCGVYQRSGSQFLDWMVGESCGVLSHSQLLHFTVVAINQIVDVLARDAPVIEELD